MDKRFQLTRLLSGDSCSKWKRRITDYQQNLLSEEERREMERHLAGCDRCTQALRETDQVLRLLEQDRPADPGPQFWEGLSARILEQIPQEEGAKAKRPGWREKGRFLPPIPAYTWAPAVILILFVSLFVYKTYLAGPKTPINLDFTALNEFKFEREGDSIGAVLEKLTSREAVQLEKRMVASLGRDLPVQADTITEGESGWDAGSLEQMDDQEIEEVMNRLEGWSSHS